jgi:hypothetical protein
MKITPGLLLLFILAILTVQAQTPDGVIEGIVVEAGTGTPVGGARIGIIQNSIGMIKDGNTDGAGKFSIKALAPGAYSVSVQRQGFAAGFLGGVNVISGQASSPVRIELKRGGVITGRVLDENKQPRSGMEVMFAVYRAFGNRPVLEELGTKDTDDRGEYRFSGLTDGDYYVIARRAPWETGTSTPTFYPGVVDMRAATKVSVAAGAEAHVGDFSLAREKNFKISLRVVPPPDWPAASLREAGTQMAARSRIMPQYWEMFAFEPSTNGRFTSYALPPGIYDLSVWLGDLNSNNTLCSQVRVTIVDKDVNAGDIRMQRGVPIQGRVLLKGEQGADFDPTRVRIVPTSEALCHISRPVPVAADGTFTFPNVPRGKLQVRAENVPPGFYVDSARYAAREVLDAGLTVENENGGPLEIGLMRSPGTVEGMARNSKGEVLAGAAVLLVPPPERQGDYYSFQFVFADKSGAFRFVGLRPGEYRILVWEGQEIPAYGDPEFLRKFDGRGVRLTVQRGATSSAGDVRALAK